MDVEGWAVLGTALASAGALAFTAWESRQQRRVLRVRLGLDFEDRLLEFQDGFYERLGQPQDGIEPPDWRRFLIHFFNFYAQLYLAHREDVFPREHWDGQLRVTLAYWVRRPEVARAWSEFRRQADAWPAGFVAFVDREIEDVPSEAERLWELKGPWSEDA